MEYKFWGWETADCKPIAEEYKGLKNPRDMYDAMTHVWCERSCAPSCRAEWSKDNMTAGQCSITSFLVQDIFGGEVYGVPLDGGGFHCYNVVGDRRFDLTSEQFGGKVLVYDEKHPQSREKHFASEEKYERYLYIKKELKAYLEKLGK